MVVVTFFLIQSARGDQVRQKTDSIPNCEVGSLMTVGYFQAPEPGTPEWERLTFSSSDEAAQDFAARYEAAGRRDEAPASGNEFRTIGHGRYYLPLPGTPEQGEVAFGIEKVGGRYMVLSVEFCSGAEPKVNIFSADG